MLDIAFELLKQIHIDSLKNLCLTHSRFYNTCNTYLWIKKFKYNQLPIINKFQHIHEWVKEYKILVGIKHTVDTILYVSYIEHNSLFKPTDGIIVPYNDSDCNYQPPLPDYIITRLKSIMHQYQIENRWDLVGIHIKKNKLYYQIVLPSENYHTTPDTVGKFIITLQEKQYILMRYLYDKRNNPFIDIIDSDCKSFLSHIESNYYDPNISRRLGIIDTYRHIFNNFSFKSL